MPDAGRDFAVARVCTDDRFGPALARELRAVFTNIAPELLAEFLIGGVAKSDLAPLRTSSMLWPRLDIDALLLAPLPNPLFQRDNSAWIGRGVVVNPMARQARRRAPHRSHHGSFSLGLRG